MSDLSTPSPGVTTVPLLDAVGLTKSYGTGDVRVDALRGVDVTIEPGSFVVVVGRSGSGKTTLLNLLGGLDEPTAGTVILNGADLAGLDDGARSAARRDSIGFVFQAFGLLPILSAAENVEVPLRLARLAADLRRARARELLDMVGLGARAGHRPDELSGGEQQRVAIARALANRPQLILADEPTGQLDTRTGQSIIELLVRLVRSEGIAMIVASHDPELRAVADHVIELRDGSVIEPPAP
jgi:putative ABC transport system ATP-binding protein